jgi:hypothetical protein
LASSRTKYIPLATGRPLSSVASQPRSWRPTGTVADFGGRVVAYLTGPNSQSQKWKFKVNNA